MDELIMAVMEYVKTKWPKVHVLAELTPMGYIPDNIVDIIAAKRHTYYMIEDYMTDDLAKALAPLASHGAVYFISDIRSKGENYDSPSTLDILWNSAMMYNWLKYLRPAKFMLKFHTPYTITASSIAALEHDYAASAYTHAAIEACSDIDFLGDHRQGKFRYIAAEKIYIQAFAGQSSTETRLVGSTLAFAEYNIEDYEDKFCYYNRIHRPFGWHTEHSDYIDGDLGIDRCGDCALMCKIFENYWKKYYGAASVRTIQGQIRKLLHIIQRNLRSRGVIHGAYTHQLANRGELTSALETLNAQIVAEENVKHTTFHTHTWSATDCARWHAVYNYLLSYGEENACRIYNACKIIDLCGVELVAQESVVSRASIMLGQKSAETIWGDVCKILQTDQSPTLLAPADIYELPRTADEDICRANWLKLVSNVLENTDIGRILVLVSSVKIKVGLPPFNGQITIFTLCDDSKNFFAQKFKPTDLVIIRIPGIERVLHAALLYFCKHNIVGPVIDLCSVDLFATNITDNIINAPYDLITKDVPILTLHKA